MDVIKTLILLTLAEDCGCVSGVYRDPATGSITDHGYLVWCPEHEAYYEDEARAEVEAELANERFWENRGWAEARFQEEMEARMGVVSYEQARDLAEGR